MLGDGGLSVLGYEDPIRPRLKTDVGERVVDGWLLRYLPDDPEFGHGRTLPFSRAPVRPCWVCVGCSPAQLNDRAARPNQRRSDDIRSSYADRTRSSSGWSHRNSRAYEIAEDIWFGLDAYRISSRSVSRVIPATFPGGPVVKRHPARTASVVSHRSLGDPAPHEEGKGARRGGQQSETKAGESSPPAKVVPNRLAARPTRHGYVAIEEEATAWSRRADGVPATSDRGAPPAASCR